MQKKENLRRKKEGRSASFLRSFLQRRHSKIKPQIALPAAVRQAPGQRQRPLQNPTPP